MGYWFRGALADSAPTRPIPRLAPRSGDSWWQEPVFSFIGLKASVVQAQRGLAGSCRIADERGRRRSCWVSRGVVSFDSVKINWREYQSAPQGSSPLWFCSLLKGRFCSNLSECASSVPLCVVCARIYLGCAETLTARMLNKWRATHRTHTNLNSHHVAFVASQRCTKQTQQRRNLTLPFFGAVLSHYSCCWAKKLLCCYAGWHLSVCNKKIVLII